MTAWTRDELDAIGNAEELRIASLRRDGTLRKPVTIWVVRVGDDVYIRSVYGRGSGWFRGTQTRHEGQVRAGGVEEDVIFVEVGDPNLNEQIDADSRGSLGDRDPRRSSKCCLSLPCLDHACLTGPDHHVRVGVCLGCLNVFYDTRI